MTEEVSENMRVAVTVYFTAALLAVVVTLLVSGIHIMNNFTDTYSTQFNAAATGTIYDLQRAKKVGCPVAFKAVTEGLSNVNKVTFKRLDGSTEILYQLKPVKDDLDVLTTKYDKVMCRVYLSDGPNGLLNVTLEEVDE